MIQAIDSLIYSIGQIGTIGVFKIQYAIMILRKIRYLQKMKDHRWLRWSAYQIGFGSCTSIIIIIF